MEECGTLQHFSIVQKTHLFRVHLIEFGYLIYPNEGLRLKPIGTITVFYPHVDDVTQSVLQSVMDKAENITDFVEKLCDHVCNEPSPPLLEYLATFFPYHIGYYNQIYRLHEAGKISALARPLYLLARSRGGERVSWDEMREAQMNALEIAPNDWITTFLYLAWRWLAELIYPECDVEIRPLRTISMSVNEDSDLTFFRIHLEMLEAEGHLRDNNRREAISHLKEALAVARNYDEQVLIADLIGEIASHVKHTDVKQAIDLFISSQDISQQLGYRHRLGLIKHHLGHIMGFRGELDAAIDYQIDYRAIRASLGLSTFGVDVIIAFFYNQMGLGEQAYQHAQTIYDYDDYVSRWRGYALSQLAWAFINLGRLDDAKKVLIETKDVALKSGDSRQMMYHRTVEGVLERAEHNFADAITCFEDILKELEKDPVPVFQNICLLNLTKIEIDMLIDTSLDKEVEFSGPWMQRLVNHAEKNDLPGIAAQASLLKAKLRSKQGRHDEVRKILKDVQKIAEAPSMRYLNEMTIAMFPDVIMS
jgi:tetratricopeptide (TPR) repeat protein